MNRKSNQSGFIALISVIILGFVLLIVVLTLGSKSVGTRFLLLDLERKDATKALAEGCVQVAIVAIVNNPSYSASNISVPVGENTCTIKSVSSGTIQATANVTGGATTNLEVEVDTSAGNEGEVLSWLELPNFP